MEASKERVLKYLFILIWVLVLMHLAAESFYLYWVFPWFDVLTHFVAGAWIGLAALWVWYFSRYSIVDRATTRRALIVAVSAGLVIGVVWEVFELGIVHLSEKTLPVNYLADSLLDLVVDTVGALVGWKAFCPLLQPADKETNEL